VPRQDSLSAAAVVLVVAQTQVQAARRLVEVVAQTQVQTSPPNAKVHALSFSKRYQISIPEPVAMHASAQAHSSVPSTLVSPVSRLRAQTWMVSHRTLVTVSLRGSFASSNRFQKNCRVPVPRQDSLSAEAVVAQVQAARRLLLLSQAVPRRLQPPR
jgi:hypothetical protein